MDRADRTSSATWCKPGPRRWFSGLSGNCSRSAATGSVTRPLGALVRVELALDGDGEAAAVVVGPLAPAWGGATEGDFDDADRKPLANRPIRITAAQASA